MSRAPFDPQTFTRSRFWLVWHRDEQRRDFIAHTVQPLHISRGGIVVYLAGSPPAKAQTVWVSLGEDVPDLALLLPAEILEIKPDTRNEAEIRLAFFQLCPEPIYRAATQVLMRDSAAL